MKRDDGVIVDLGRWGEAYNASKKGQFNWAKIMLLSISGSRELRQGT